MGMNETYGKRPRKTMHAAVIWVRPLRMKKIKTTGTAAMAISVRTSRATMAVQRSNYTVSVDVCQLGS